MNRIQFFYSSDIVALQQKINDWLASNKDIFIEETNIASLGKPSQRAGIMSTEKYVFYIRYTSTANNSMTLERSAEHEEPVSVKNLESSIGSGIHN